MAAGYGRGGWSSGKYGQPTSIEVTGVSATGAVGSVTITEGSGVSTAVTGLAGTGAVNSVRLQKAQALLLMQQALRQRVRLVRLQYQRKVKYL